MATATNRKLCDVCGKAKGVSKCEGCSKIFCYNHFGDHRQELNQQLDEVEVSRDIFRQTLTEQTTEPEKHTIILQQINEWERVSIRKIQKTAEEARDLLLKHTSQHIIEIEKKLNKLTDQLRESRQENDFVETDIRHWKEQLTQLTTELVKPPNITLQQESKPLVSKIYVDVSTDICRIVVPPSMMKIDANTRWKPNGITVAGYNDRGCGLNQLNSPWGMYIDDDQSIYIADMNNHRIVKWNCNQMIGQVVAGGNGAGNRADQLNEPIDVIVDKKSESLIISDIGNKRVVRWPRQNDTSGQTIISNVCCRGLSMDNNGQLYVPDVERHEVRRWRIGETTGTLVAGGNGQGNRLDQLDCPAFVFVDQDHSIYISDENNDRVMKWVKNAKEGIIVAGGQGSGNAISQLSSPRGVVVDLLGNVYISDCYNHRIMLWSKGATQCIVVAGGNGSGKKTNQLFHPQDLSLDRQGNFYVVDMGNDRVQRFDINSTSNSQ